MRRRSHWSPLVISLVAAALVLWAAACDSGDGQDGDTTTTTEAGGQPSGDLEGTVGSPTKVTKAVITVRVLDATFNPVVPEQRMSEQTPSAPSGDESFYQANVKIANKGSTPIRVDPEDFACAVGSTVVGIEPTWSGPIARSLLKNSSLDLLVTFKGKAGYEPVLLYSPSWYDGTIRIRNASVNTITTK
jgi:hypothetical protein